VLWFSFFCFFFEFYAHIFESWSNPRFNQDLNKFKTWKLKGKHVSFLVTLKWSFWDVLEISMFETQNDFDLFMLDFIRSTGGRYMICLVWIYLDLVYQLECLRYDIRKLFALVFLFADFFFNFDAHLNLGQILGLTMV
jgi:hypothetical protein